MSKTKNKYVELIKKEGKLQNQNYVYGRKSYEKGKGGQRIFMIFNIRDSIFHQIKQLPF